MPLPLSLSKGDIVKAKSPWEIMPVGLLIIVSDVLTNEQVEFFRNKFAGSQANRAERAMKEEAEAKKVTEKLNTTKITGSTLKLRWLMKPHKQMLLSSVRFAGMISDVDCSAMVVKLGYTDLQGSCLTKLGNQSSTLVRHNEEQTNLPDGSAQPKITIGKQYTKIISAANIVKNLLIKSIHKENTENISATNTVKTLTMKATYKENIVKFPFSVLDGLVKLEELVATRFKLSPGCLRLKYADADGDMILTAYDSDLMRSAGDSR
ncbi:NIN-like protein [Tanacetum coccineum]